MSVLRKLEKEGKRTYCPAFRELQGEEDEQRGDCSADVEAGAQHLKSEVSKDSRSRETRVLTKLNLG